MASRSGLGRVSRTIRSHRIHLQPSRRQYSSQLLFTSTPTCRIHRPTRTASHHVLQQSRNLSLWGSSKPAAVASTSNVTVTEPIDFEHARTIKANDTSAHLHSHSPNAIEPTFLEQAQQSIAEPHGAKTPDATNIEDIPERIGYLKEVCGLDFGWGPSAMMENLLEYIHIWGGLSWSASIICIGLVIRGALLPLMVRGAHQSAKLKIVAPLLEPIKAEATAAQARDDKMKLQQARLQIQNLYKEHDIKMFRPFLPILLQIPLGFGAWRVTRNCASTPVPAFITEQFLWLRDLTFADDFYILPAVSSLLIYASMKMNQKMNASSSSAIGNQGMMALLTKALPFLSFIFVSFQPGAVQLYFIASSAAGFATTAVMAWGPTRHLLGLPPLKPDETPTLMRRKSSIPESKPKQSFMNIRSNKVIDVKARVQEGQQKDEHAHQNISIIDKGVNVGKAAWVDTKKNWDQMVNKAGAKEKQKQKMIEKETQDNARYQAQVRQRLEQQRKERNARHEQ